MEKGSAQELYAKFAHLFDVGHTPELRKSILGNTIEPHKVIILGDFFVTQINTAFSEPTTVLGTLRQLPPTHPKYELFKERFNASRKKAVEQYPQFVQFADRMKVLLQDTEDNGIQDRIQDSLSKLRKFLDENQQFS